MKDRVYDPISKTTYDRHCKGCTHLIRVGAWGCCNYIFDMGHSRPCPPGKHCTVKTKKKRLAND